MVVRGNVTYEKLENIYNVVNAIIKKPECYYSEEEVMKLKTNDKNIFIEKRKRHEDL